MRPRFDPNRGLENVRDILTVLNATGVRSWVQDGTLLGIVRDGKPIPWDHDTDTGARIEDLHDGVLPALAAAGFTLKGALGAPENGLQWRLVRDGIKTDVFWYYPNPDGTHWHAAYVGGSLQWRFTYPVFPVAPIDTSVGSMLAPAPPEAFLETKYGPGWRTPTRRWHFATSPLNGRRA